MTFPIIICKYITVPLPENQGQQLTTLFLTIVALSLTLLSFSLSSDWLTTHRRHTCKYAGFFHTCVFNHDSCFICFPLCMFYIYMYYFFELK